MCFCVFKFIIGGMLCVLSNIWRGVIFKVVDIIINCKLLWSLDCILSVSVKLKLLWILCLWNLLKMIVVILLSLGFCWIMWVSIFLVMILSWVVDDVFDFFLMW